MALPSNFDAATFLYLNPELGAYSNILSIELARDYFLTTPSASNMIYNFETLPKDFDGRIFLADNKDGLNVSQLNHTIKIAMSNEGYTPYDIDSFSQYLPTVYKDLRLMSNNVFRFKDLDYAITSNNLMVGDEIKINVENLHYVFSKVTDIDTDVDTFTVSNYFASSFSNPDLKYNLVGHKIYDAERLSKTNYVRNNRSSNPIYGDFSNRFYGLDPGFNPEIYKLFYPDARLMTDEQCVLDYTSRRNNNDIRIGKSDEIVKSIDYVYTELRNLRVSCNCKVNGSFILGPVGYEFIVNGITSNYTRSSSNASDSNLITEKASKGYLDQMLTDTMVLTNLIVRSNATFCNSVNMLSNLYVGGIVSHCNDMIRTGNLLNDGNIFVSQNISLSNNLSVNNNASVSCNLTVGSNTNILNSIFVSNTAFFGESIHASNHLFVGSNVSLSNNLFVGSNSEIVGNLAVRSNFVLEGDQELKSSLYVSSNISVSNNTYINSNLYVGSNVAISNDLTVNRHITANSNIYCNSTNTTYGDILGFSNLTISNNSYIYGNMFGYSNLELSGNASFSNDLFVKGTITCGSNATILGTMKIGASNNIGSLLLDVLGGVRADEYFLSSDVRVKQNIENLDTDKCLDFVRNSPVIKYNLKYDYLSKPRYGFLAHKLEEIDKNVICNITDFIPDMMKQVSVKDAGWICLENHSYTKDLKIKIFYGEKSHSLTILDVKKNKIKIDSSFGGKDIFIYGKEIRDFKAIDYTQMFAITMGALQKTIEKVNILEKQIEELKSLA